MKKFCNFIIFSLFIAVSFYQSKAIAAVIPPTVSLNVPSSIRGITTITVTYSFPDANGGLYLDAKIPSWPYPIRFYTNISILAGSSDFVDIPFSSAGWPDGPITITATGYYIGIFGQTSVSQSIISDNAPRLTINSPSGNVRGITDFNISYDFPSVGGGMSGLFYIYRDNSPNVMYSKQIPLNSASPTTGVWKFPYETTGWSDGQHTIKVVASMGICFSCSAILPSSGTQEVKITSSNAPIVQIMSPSGSVKGIISGSITYDFPSTAYSQGYIWLERQVNLNYSTIVSKTISLSPVQSTTGTWNFTFNVSGWTDKDYNLRAQAIYSSKIGYDYKTIKVVNKMPVIAKDKEVSGEKATFVGEPINVANGSMSTEGTDIVIPSGELALGLSRAYSSQDNFNGAFGWGWRSNFDITLKETTDKYIVEEDEKAVATIYSPNANGSYTASAGKYFVLTKNSDGTFIILRKHGQKLYFNANGLLVKIEDRNGNSLIISRGLNGVISEVSDSLGRKLSFTSDAQGKITQITDSTNRIFKYEYDTNGNLIKFTDPLDNQTIYQYDTNHNITKVTDPLNHALFFEYDVSDRAYHSWQDNRNNEVTLVFNPTNKTTNVTDSLGNLTKYEYNGYGLVTKITNSQDNTQTFTWDTNLNKTSSTDQNNNLTAFTYDTRGNLLTVKDALDNTSSFIYEPNFDFLSSRTNTQNKVTEYSYDIKGNLIQVKDVLNNISAYTYDAYGNLTQAIDVNNHAANFKYDSYNNLIQTTDALGNQTNFAYDALGNKTKITDAQGKITVFDYDLLNRLVKITYPDNSKVIYFYDSAGNLISAADQNNNATTNAYDEVNRLISVTDAQGSVNKYIYDTEGNKLTVADANQNKTQYFYDSLNRLIKTVDPLNNQIVFAYDPAGNLISKTDANNNTINYAYDELNRLTQKLYPDQTQENFTYDSESRMLTAENINLSYNFIYDALGRLTQVTDSNNQILSYTYDAVGNKITSGVTSASSVSLRGSAEAISSNFVTYSYDALNRLSSIIDHNNQTTAYSYDSLSRRIKTTLPDKTTTSYAYDSLGNLLNLDDKTSGNKVISSYKYTYDLVGNRKTESRSGQAFFPPFPPSFLPQTISYAYDKAYQLTQAIPKMSRYFFNRPEYYKYDLAGNRLSSSSTYNSANQLTSSQNHNYEYDLNGNLIKDSIFYTNYKTKKVIPVHITEYSYDYENRLVSVRKTSLQGVVGGNPATLKLLNSTTYSYDPFGKRITKKVTSHQSLVTSETNYIYDGEDIILESHLRGGAKPLLGPRLSEAAPLPSGLRGGDGSYVTRYLHGPGIDEPISMSTENTSEVAGTSSVSLRGSAEAISLNTSGKTYYYHYNGLGSVTALTDKTGKVVQSYNYDSFGNIRYPFWNRIQQPYTYTGREYDQETGLYYYRNRYYDPKVGRFLTQDPIGFAGGMNLYGYVGNNPVNFTDPLGFCAEPVPIWEDPVFGVTSSIMLGARVVFAGLSAGERTVLYYGQNAWKLAAASSGVPIFKTAIGNIMNKFENISGFRLPQVVWDVASAIYASGARGTVQVFSTLSEYSKDYSSTFYRIEAPIIHFLERLGKAEMAFK